LMGKLVTSHFLFLGYSLRDWNVRAILRRIWEEQRRKKKKSFAIQLNPEELEAKSWSERGAEIIDVDLDTYVAGLRAHLEALPAVQPAST
jgi:hypothetical protein